MTNFLTGDFLIRIKNAYRARQSSIEAPFSKSVFSIGKILEKEKFIKKIKEREKDNKKTVEIELLYENGAPAVRDIKLISKPSLHLYKSKNEIKNSIKNYGIGIVSTSKGIMTARDASKSRIGGELICQVF